MGIIMINIKVKLKQYKQYIAGSFLIAFSFYYLLSIDTSKIYQPSLIFFLLAFLLGITAIISAIYQKREKVIWYLCYIVFIGIVLFDIYMDIKEDNVPSQTESSSAILPSDSKNKPLGTSSQDVSPQELQNATTTEEEKTENVPLTKQQVFESVEQDLANIMKSEAFKKILQEGYDTGKMPDILTSYTKFQDFLSSQGVDVGAVSVGANNLSQAMIDGFEKVYPGRKPTDLDDQMKANFVLLIMEKGYETARFDFLYDPKVAVWAAARFDIFGETPDDIQSWTDNFSSYGEEMLSDDFGSYTVFEMLGINDEDVSDTPESPLQEVDENISTEVSVGQQALSETHTTPSTQDDTRPTQTKDVESKNFTQYLDKYPKETIDVVTVTDRLRRDFSENRVHSAIAHIMLYGPEEGLQRIKKYDTEIAVIIETLLPLNERTKQ